MWRKRDAVARDHRDRLRELDWRERVVALADAGGDAVAQVPLAVFFAKLLPRKALPLPLSRRQYAGKLAFDVDPGLAAETELRHEAVRVVDVGLAREYVVVRVARSHDGLVHVHGAVAALLVVVEPMRGSRELEVAGIEDRLRRRALA